MTRRILAILTCLLLVFAAGCDFFAVPSSTPAASASALTTESPADTTSASPSDTSLESASPDATTSDSTSTASPGATTSESSATDTPEPTATPAPTADATEGMIFPDSDTTLLMWNDLISLSSSKLTLAKNEIYARAGYKFTTKKYADYYGKLSWYSVDSSFSESNFTDIQLANIHLIIAATKALSGQLYEIASGTKLDYDQDGKLETLTFKVPDDNHVNISIKDGSATTNWNINCDNPIKKVFLGDIDFKDGKLDLFVGEAGPSDDYSVYVAGVKQGGFLQRGTIPGAINSGSAKDPFKLDGKGHITTLRRMDIISTDFFIVRYKLSSAGKLVFSPFASYNFLSYSASKYMVTTKVAIPLNKSASTSSVISYTIPAGTKVQLVSTDGVKWIKIKAPGGTGWIQMASPLVLANPNLNSTDAFDGLIMAD